MQCFYIKYYFYRTRVWSFKWRWRLCIIEYDLFKILKDQFFVFSNYFDSWELWLEKKTERPWEYNVKPGGFTLCAICALLAVNIISWTVLVLLKNLSTLSWGIPQGEFIRLQKKSPQWDILSAWEIEWQRGQMQIPHMLSTTIVQHYTDIVFLLHLVANPYNIFVLKIKWCSENQTYCQNQTCYENQIQCEN